MTDKEKEYINYLRDNHFEIKIKKKDQTFILRLDESGKRLKFHASHDDWERVVKSFEFRNDLDGGFKTAYPHSLFYSMISGAYIHSDVNGAYNIGRLLLPNLFNERTISPKDMLISPLKVKSLNRVRKSERIRITNKTRAGLAPTGVFTA